MFPFDDEDNQLDQQQIPGGGYFQPPQFPGEGFFPQPNRQQFPGGGPFQPPGQPPFQGGGPGSQQQGAGSPPSGPPPQFVPQMSTAQGAQVFAVDPGSMRGCLYRYTYVWLNTGNSFWFFPTFIGRNSVAGWRWRQRANRWVYFGIDTRQIRSFQCF
ncbi:transporter [Peribacillus saganii]|uniref:Transporter n=2 Tax=Peribacillus saganii TaxID=2303992 RepID=A0A372LTR1_9BACI|nr:transporter [Peribacillus saganii]